MQTITIDLKKNPDVADLIADMDPGAKICLYTGIKAKDDQTLTLTLDSAEQCEDKSDDEDESEEEDSEESDEAETSDEKPKKKMLFPDDSSS
jgi:hypothetical protein